MKFSEMKPKQLKEAKDELKERTLFFNVSKVIRLDDNGVMLEGGKFPVTYDHSTKEITLWGRANRNAGAPVKIGELEKLEDILFFFFIEAQEVDDV